MRPPPMRIGRRWVAFHSGMEARRVQLRNRRGVKITTIQASETMRVRKPNYDELNSETQSSCFRVQRRGSHYTQRPALRRGRHDTILPDDYAW